MENNQEVDFDEIKKRIQEIQKMVRRGHDTPEGLQSDDILEGCLLIATKSIRIDDGPLTQCVEAVTSMGGFVDPVAHKLAIMMINTPEFLERMLHWMDKETIALKYKMDGKSN